jgi:hypothetical protein
MLVPVSGDGQCTGKDNVVNSKNPDRVVSQSHVLDTWHHRIPDRVPVPVVRLIWGLKKTMKRELWMQLRQLEHQLGLRNVLIVTLKAVMRQHCPSSKYSKIRPSSAQTLGTLQGQRHFFGRAIVVEALKNVRKEFVRPD